MIGRRIHDQERKSRAEERKGELGWAGEIDVPPGETQPHRGEHRREGDNEKWRRRLKPERRHLPAEDAPVGEVPREQIQRRGRLLVRGPERGGEDEQHQDDHGAFELGARETGEEEQIGEVPERQGADEQRHLLRDGDRVDRNGAGHRQRDDDRQDRDGAERDVSHATLLLRSDRRRETDGAQRAGGAGAKRQEAEQHAGAGGTESPVPAHSLTERARQERCDEGAEVDAHVEDRKAAVESGATLRIQGTDDGRDVRLEQPCPHDDENEAEEECLVREQRREGDGEVTERDQHATPPDRPAKSQPAIGNPSAGQRRQIHRRCIDADDRRRGFA